MTDGAPATPSDVAPATPSDVAPLEARAASAVPDDGDDLTWLPAWRLRELIVGGAVSSVEVVRHFLRRIEEHDPRLTAMRRVEPGQALAQAERADASLRAGEAPGPLHGVPIGVKELFSVRGFPAPGSYSSYLVGEKTELPLATRDDLEVERLRAAGAIVVGVNVGALGGDPADPDLSHLSRNPWNLDHTPGGSSAGGGAAVAGGLLPLSLGDDGAGSIRIPAAFCALIGLAPTRGLVPHVDYQSVAPRPTVAVGPLARDARDAAITLQVLAGPDGRDFVALPDDPPDYLATLHAGVAGMRFLWTENLGFGSIPESVRSPRTITTVRDGAAALERAGAEIVTGTATWEDPLRSWLAAAQLMTGPGMAGYGEGLSDAEVVAALDSRDRNWHIFRRVFAEHDFVLTPTIQFPAPAMRPWVELCAEEGGSPKHWLWMDSLSANLSICNLLGLPAISVPAGFVDGMPVGLQVIGRPRSEAGLLRVAQALLAASAG